MVRGFCSAVVVAGVSVGGELSQDAAGLRAESSRKCRGVFVRRTVSRCGASGVQQLDPRKTFQGPGKVLAAGQVLCGRRLRGVWSFRGHRRARTVLMRWRQR